MSVDEHPQLFPVGQRNRSGDNHRATPVGNDRQAPVLLGRPLLGFQTGRIGGVEAVGIETLPDRSGHPPQIVGVELVGELDHHRLRRVTGGRRKVCRKLLQSCQDSLRLIDRHPSLGERIEDRREPVQLHRLANQRAGLSTGAAVRTPEERGRGTRWTRSAASRRTTSAITLARAAWARDTSRSSSSTVARASLSSSSGSRVSAGTIACTEVMLTPVC